MAQTIRAPVGSRQGPRILAALSYSAGSVMGGVGLGAALGVAGHLAAEVAPIDLLAVLVGFVAWAAAATGGSKGWPERQQQIPRWWVQPRTMYGLVLAGLVLGSGVFTRIRYALFYVMLATMLLSGAWEPYLSLVIGAAYGGVNGVTPVLQTGNVQMLTSRTHATLLSGGLKCARILAAIVGFGVIALLVITISP